MANRLLGSLVVGLSLGFAACSGENLTLPPSTGTLEITTATGGTEPDPDGYTLQVDALQPQSIGSSATVSVEELTPGTHNVVLTGLAANCSVTGDNPRSVTVAVGQTTTSTFDLTCGGTTGALEVTTQTSGDVPDADGYAISFDGTDRGPIGPSEVVTLNNLPAGGHVVGLTGVAANCQVQGDNLRAVTITAGGTATLTFAVTCVHPPPVVGILRVTTTTTGQGQDADGYRFAVDGAEAQPIGSNDVNDLTNTAVGVHSVVLSNIADNCTVDGASKNGIVTQGATTTVAFNITCGAATGSIRVTTSTSGNNPDPNGYQFAIDGGANQPVGPNDSRTVAAIPVGSRTVVLSDIASNCSVAGGASKSVSVTAGAISDVGFSVTCTGVGIPTKLAITTQPPAAVEIGQTLSPAPVVQIQDNAGNPVAAAGVDITVVLKSAGSARLEGTLTVASDGNGQATFSDLKVTGATGGRQLLFTADGYTSATSTRFDVNKASTTTTITAQNPNPSDQNVPVTVSFTVSSSAGTPTGDVEVTISGGGAPCTGTLSSGSGSCQLTGLTTPGDRTVTATYKGSPLFATSLGTAPHTVNPPANPAPVANDDAYPATAGTTLTVGAPGVLGNDTDDPGDVMAAEVVTQPVGTLTLNPDGAFDYTPATAAGTTDSFTYQVRDLHGNVSNVATVTITIN